MSPKKIITVVGATGNQGAGVVEALLKNPAYHVRGTTRRTDSDSAKALRSKGAEVIQADVNDLESLKKAFAGSHVIYAVTDFFEPFAKFGPEKAMEIETQQGINLATAAAATPTLEHYIWSTLPNGRAISSGKYLVPHFEAKNHVDAHIRANAALLAKTTFLWITWYHSNYAFPMFTPYLIPTAGTYVQFATHSPQTPIDTIGDVRANVGPFVAAILAAPERTRHGVIVQAAITTTTFNELLQTWAHANNTKGVVVPTDVATYNALWPRWAEEMGVMMRFWDEFKDKSWTDASGKVLTRADLDIDESAFSSLETALGALKY